MFGALAGAGGQSCFIWPSIEYLNKKQQQSLLECIENGSVTLDPLPPLRTRISISTMRFFGPAVQCLNSKSLAPKDVERGVSNALQKLSDAEGVPVETDP